MFLPHYDYDHGNNLSADQGDVSPTQDIGFIIALNISVGIVCLLSILGSTSIIFSYILYKELRTTGRFILLNLSVADLIVALANLLGAAMSPRFRNVNDPSDINDSSSLLALSCKIDAFFGLFATDSSILWTIVLLSYLYITLHCFRPSRSCFKVSMTICMIICWGLPLAISVWFISKNFFGFQPGFSPGFCTFTGDNDGKDIYRPIVGYEMFLYPSIIFLTTISIAFFCHAKCKKKPVENYHYIEHHLNSIKAAERKLLFVPIVFIFIRIWGLITDVTTFYLNDNQIATLRNSKISPALIFMAGIGDSSQGFVNGIFFCLLTPPVRQRLLLLLFKCGRICRCYCCSRYETLVNDAYITPTTSRSLTISYTNSTASRGGGVEGEGDGDNSTLSRSLGTISADISLYGSNEIN
ncbi:PREDICTED: probable G-protein coupled receptor 157 [Amphimedon queenslandica]|uniref:G-protein coupled receptors family 1 profile domain-containing protein n=1 Tax=Amphimedon queenslandica TaxID=400682 RepID=A0A1X7UQJ0_AMPQE|nr:PREDICTED: probable G-protein coupled receptor 157 [Amphimedon queenslandica]|eukprot:XP_019852988.1 PREDICTED: probable G-protein coupled receptor 157 [Amphimedon queenslandica]